MRTRKIAVTIDDIARFARVSKSTVSRVLNDADTVSESALKRVKAAMRALNYRPSATARNLARQRSNTIALIVQDIRNPYYAFASWFVEKQFRAKGFHLVVFNADNSTILEREVLETVASLRVEGLLCVGGNRDATDLVTFHSHNDLPAVLIDREVKGYDIPTINLDNHYGGGLAAEYLVSLGHRSLLFATSDFTEAEMRRREGFLEALRAQGIAREDCLIFTQEEEKWSGGDCRGLAPFFDSPAAPSAVFASNDLKAMHVIRFLHERGISVPDEVSVFGFDDTPMASVTVPSLSTMRQPQQGMIKAGMDVLTSMIEGSRPPITQRLFLPELVVRESTRRPPEHVRAMGRRIGRIPLAAEETSERPTPGSG
jgi:LacI family transcriptional regulator